MTVTGAENVTVGPSRIHGQGVFAARDLRAGDLIFVRDETREVTSDMPLRQDLGEVECHCDWLENGRQVLLPAPECYVNHGCDPNSYTRWQEGLGRGQFALRAIRRGEEVTVSYLANLSGGKAWECSCGSPRCLRRCPGDFFELPLEWQMELRPLLEDWFIAEHRDQCDALQPMGKETE